MTLEAQSAQRSSEDVGGVFDRDAVVVVPFSNLSGESSDDWIGMGIAQTVSADLNRLGLSATVPGDRTMSQGDRGARGLGLEEDARARALARRLGAAWTVTGGFQRMGERLRVVARTIDVESGHVRRTVTLDGTTEQLFALQDRLVASLAGAFDAAAAVDAGPTSPPSPRRASGQRVEPPVAVSAGAVAGPRGAGLASPAGFAGRAESAPGVAGAEFGILSGRPVLRPTRTETPPDIDGRIADEVWRNAAAITEFVQQAPLDGAPATEATEVRLAYDSQNIYLAFHVHYADPSIMRANRVDRDQTDQDDLITVYFDTFLDQQRSYVFDINGYGVQGDGIINNTGFGRRGGRGRRGGGGGGQGPQAIPAADRSWDALYASAARIVPDGYTAEMAIPFKSLRYPQLDPQTPHRWGFQVVRSIRGKDEEADVWSPMSRDVRAFMTQMGVLEGMTGLSTSRNLEFLPTFTGIQFGSLDAATGGFPEAFNGEGGLDFKYGITSNLTADFTFNPDFSQIESDLPQIEVNQRFALFFPELRPFFLEGQEIFQFSSPVNWVNTRTIVDPRFGAKLTGKVGDVTLGFLAADDEAPGSLDDTADPAFGQTAQVFVTRVRYDLYAESHVGGLVTDREFLDSYSRAVGVDGQFAIGQTARLDYMAFQTMNRDLDGVETSGPSWALFFQRPGRNLGLTSFAGRNHPDAATDVGFLRRADTQGFRQNVSYRWWPEGWIINWGPRLSYERIYDYDGILADEVVNVGVDLTMADNITAGAGVERALERFGGIDFWKWRYTTRAEIATSRLVSVGGELGWGDQISFSENPFLGRGVDASLNLLFRPLARFQSQINLESSRLRDLRSGGVEVFDIKLFRALSTYQFTERLQLRNITEFNTFEDTVGMNFLATYRINAGTVFFLGYDDRYRQRDQFESMGDELFLRRDLQRTNRAIFTKLQVLFRL